MKIHRILEGIDVQPLRERLIANPELWDQHTMRTANPASPHHGLSDIWVRFAAPGVNGAEPHESVWYPSADALGVRPLAYGLMARLWGDQLGGVLITRIPAGAQCKPHTDPGWHARYYDKFAISVQAAPRQVFGFKDEELVTKPGDLFWFDNSFEHWVTNPTDEDRITAIFCIRRADVFRSKPWAL